MGEALRATVSFTQARYEGGRNNHRNFSRRAGYGRARLLFAGTPLPVFLTVTLHACVKEVHGEVCSGATYRLPLHFGDYLNPLWLSLTCKD